MTIVVVEAGSDSCRCLRINCAEAFDGRTTSRHGRCRVYRKHRSLRGAQEQQSKRTIPDDRERAVRVAFEHKQHSQRSPSTHSRASPSIPRRHGAAHLIAGGRFTLGPISRHATATGDQPKRANPSAYIAGDAGDSLAGYGCGQRRPRTGYRLRFKSAGRAGVCIFLSTEWSLVDTGGVSAILPALIGRANVNEIIRLPERYTASQPLALGTGSARKCPSLLKEDWEVTHEIAAWPPHG